MNTPMSAPAAQRTHTTPDDRSEALHAALAAVEAFASGRLIGFDTDGRCGLLGGPPCPPADDEGIGQC